MKILFILSTLLWALVASEPTLKPFESSKIYSMSYDKNSTGLVRHLPVYKNPKWVAKIKSRKGKEIFFCSPKSMFEFYFYPGKWYDVGIRSERDFSEIVVTDYNTAKAIDAEKAFYVYGSSVVSPAGDDLVAFVDRASADKFAKSHSGKRVMSFDSVSDALIRLLNGNL